MAIDVYMIFYCSSILWLSFPVIRIIHRYIRHIAQTASRLTHFVWKSDHRVFLHQSIWSWFVENWVWVNTYRYILVGWTSIYQLFWCSPGVQGFDTLPIGTLSKGRVLFLWVSYHVDWRLTPSPPRWIDAGPHGAPAFKMRWRVDGRCDLSSLRSWFRQWFFDGSIFSIFRVQMLGLHMRSPVTKDIQRSRPFDSVCPWKRESKSIKSIKIHHIEPLALLGVGNCLSNTKATGQRDSTAWGSWWPSGAFSCTSYDIICTSNTSMRFPNVINCYCFFYFFSWVSRGSFSQSLYITRIQTKTKGCLCCFIVALFLIVAGCLRAPFPPSPSRDAFVHTGSGAAQHPNRPMHEVCTARWSARSTAQIRLTMTRLCFLMGSMDQMYRRLMVPLS